MQTSPPRFSAYVASKSALDAFTRVVSSETIGDNVTFTTIHMPLVRTPMIAPTKMYDSFPTISPEEAADLVCEAIRAKPKQINTKLGTFGEVAYALAPKAVDQILHLAYRVFPESTAAKGGKDGGRRRRQGLRRGDRARLSDEGRALVTLSSGGLEATFEPAGGDALRVPAPRRRGAAGATSPSTSPTRRGRGGIPLLHPWANRLGGFAYTFDGAAVALDRADLYLEEHGLPLHGLRAAVTGWEPTFASETRIVAGRDVTDAAAFPFPHRVTVAAELSPAALTITTTLTAGERPVPIAFGHHPFFRLPGVPRAEWEITLPVDEHITVDERLIPTGERTPAGELDGPLGDRTFDDGYTYAGGPFVLQGGGRRIEVAFERGLRVRAGVRAEHRRPRLLRADDRARRRAAARAGRRRARRVFSARFSVTIMRVSER